MEAKNEFIQEQHLLQFIKFYTRDVGLINHQISSYNELVKPGGGIENILKKFFHFTQDIPAKASSQYTYVNLDIQFSNVEFKKPYAAKRSENIKSAIAVEYEQTPSMVRKIKGNYEAEMYFDIKITLTPYKKIVNVNGEDTLVMADQLKTLERENINIRDIQLDQAVYDLKHIFIAHIPVMVKSIICNLHDKNAVELVNIYQDDPTDKGGYFLLKGNDWVIQSIDSILYNMVHIRFIKKGNKELIKGMIITREDESGFGHSFQTIFRLYSDNIMTIEINNPNYTIVEIPFQVFFRMMGVSTDRKITEYILYDPEDESKLSNEIWNVLSDSFDKVPSQFKEVIDERDQGKLLEFVGKLLTKKQIEQQKQSQDQQFVSYTFIKYDTVEKLKALTMQLFLEQYLTQFPKEDLQDNVDKQLSDTLFYRLMFTGLIFRQLIMSRLGILKETDRDSLKSKRIVSPGVQFAREIKTVTSNNLIKPIVSKIKDLIAAQGFNHQNLKMEDIIKKQIASNEINKILKQALTTGEYMIYSKKKAIPNRISSQEQLRKNQIYTLQALRMIQTNEGKGPSSERGAELRQVHPSFIGFICPFQTPESSRRIGINKQLAILADITGNINSSSLWQLIKADKDIFALSDIKIESIVKNKQGKIFINGMWYGCTQQGLFLLRQKYVQYRREKKINQFTSIVVDILNGILYFWTDSGRLIRPLLIVYGNEGHQYIKVTKELMNDLTTRKTRFQDLIDMQVMEYISAEEQENCLIAQSIGKLYENNRRMIEEKQEWKKNKGNINELYGKIYAIRNYTHVEIEQSTLGIIALVDPFANHSQSQRATMETNQGKQTCSWPSLDFAFRYPKAYFFQHAYEMPLVKTIANDISLPGGQNVVLAILISTGHNQLDSIIVNKNSMERGLFACTSYTSEQTELEKNEIIEPYSESMQGNQTRGSYQKLDAKGIIKINSLVKKGDVLLNKKTKVNKSGEDGGIQIIDNPLIYSKSEEAIADQILFQDETDKQLFKIRLKSLKLIGSGDKFSTRIGCKGTVGEIQFSEDMPYTKDGIIPDIVMSPLSAITRMIVGQLLEMTLSRKMVIEGTISDGSPFAKIDLDDALEKLKEYGIENSEETLYCGKTGEKMKAKVFMAPCFYQRLQKFASSEFYCTSGGPRNATTRQPLEGKTSQGGLKLGEMEKDTVIGQGATKFLREKFHKDSDGYKQFNCKTCGSLDVIVNEGKGIYRCDLCKENAEIVCVPSTWCNNVFFKEIQSMGINIKANIKPKEYYI